MAGRSSAGLGAGPRRNRRCGQAPVFQQWIVSRQACAFKAIPISGPGGPDACRVALSCAVIAVVQRVSAATVRVDDQPISSIGHGLAVLAAIERGDGDAEARWMAAKLAALRVFSDEARQSPYDRDVRQVQGSILLVSNFTVAAACEKGRRPSLDGAAPPQEAQPMFNLLAALLGEEGAHVESGRFGAMMQVELLNEGPVTLIVRTPRAGRA